MAQSSSTATSNDAASTTGASTDNVAVDLESEHGQEPPQQVEAENLHDLDFDADELEDMFGDVSHEPTAADSKIPVTHNFIPGNAVPKDSMDQSVENCEDTEDLIIDEDEDEAEDGDEDGSGSGKGATGTVDAASPAHRVVITPHGKSTPVPVSLAPTSTPSTLSPSPAQFTSPVQPRSVLKHMRTENNNTPEPRKAVELANTRRAEPVHIRPYVVRNWLHADVKSVIIDIRPEDQFKAAHISQARSIPCHPPAGTDSKHQFSDKEVTRAIKLARGKEYIAVYAGTSASQLAVASNFTVAMHKRLPSKSPSKLIAWLAGGFEAFRKQFEIFVQTPSKPAIQIDRFPTIVIDPAEQKEESPLRVCIARESDFSTMKANDTRALNRQLRAEFEESKVYLLSSTEHAEKRNSKELRWPKDKFSAKYVTEKTAYRLIKEIVREKVLAKPTQSSSFLTANLAGNGRKHQSYIFWSDPDDDWAAIAVTVAVLGFSGSNMSAQQAYSHVIMQGRSLSIPDLYAMETLCKKLETHKMKTTEALVKTLSKKHYGTWSPSTHTMAQTKANTQANAVISPVTSPTNTIRKVALTNTTSPMPGRSVSFPSPVATQLDPAVPLLRQQLKEAKQELQKKLGELSEVKQENERLRRTEKELQKHADQTIEDMDGVINQLEQAETERAKTDDALVAAENEREQLMNALEVVDTDLQKLKEENTALKEENTDNDQKLQSLKQQLVLMKQLMAQKEREHNEISSQLAKSRALCEELKCKADGLDDDLTKAITQKTQADDARVLNAQSKIQDLAEKLQTNVTESDRLNQELDTAKSDLGRVQEELSRNKLAMEKLKQEWSKEQQDVTTELKLYKKERDAIHDENARLKQDATELAAQTKLMKENATVLTTQLQQARSERQQVIQVVQEYDESVSGTAVESASRLTFFAVLLCMLAFFILVSSAITSAHGDHEHGIWFLPGLYSGQQSAAELYRLQYL
jgi:Rhodanese-like domain